MELPDHVLYWLVSGSKAVAAEVSPSQSNRRAWVIVFPEVSNRDSSEKYYLVIYTEVEKDVLQVATEKDISIENEERLNRQIIKVADISELPQVLLQWMDDLSKLVQPYFCDYPF